MRNAALALIVVALAASSAVAQTQAPTGPWAQKIFYGVTSHEFGVVPRGAQLKHSFRMKNIYAVPLEITNIRSTCGCLTFTPSARYLKPQEEGTIDILMDGRRFTGPKSITLYITVGPEYISTAAIQVTANARSDVVFNPGQVDFGIVHAGQTPMQTIDVEYAGALDWRLLEVVKNSEAPFRVEARELYRSRGNQLFRQAGKVGYQLAVTLKPNPPPGPFRHEMMLKTNDPSSPVLTVVVEGNVQASLSVAPNVVNLGDIRTGETTTRRVQVRGSRPFRIVAIEGTGSGLTAELPTRLSPVHVITVACHPDRPGEIHRELRFRTNLDDGASVSVAVDANVMP